MQWPLRRYRTVQRTCLDCGETWTLDAGLAHRRTGGLHGFFTASRAIRSEVRGQPTDFVDDTYAALDQQSEMVAEARSCPKCGSDHHKDRPA